MEVIGYEVGNIAALLGYNVVPLEQALKYTLITPNPHIEPPIPFSPPPFKVDTLNLLEIINLFINDEPHADVL